MSVRVNEFKTYTVHVKDNVNDSDGMSHDGRIVIPGEIY